MQVLWNPPERGAWDALHRSAAGALQQHWSYGAALQSGTTRCLRAVVTHDGAPVALAQFMSRRVGLVVEVALCTRGPVWLAPLDAAGRSSAVRAIRQSFPVRRPRVVLCSPDEPASETAGSAGRYRVMTGYSTVLIDLTRPLDQLRADLTGNWRNRLASAERSALKVQRGGTKPAQYGWLLEREAAQRDRKTYRGLPLAFVAAYQAACPDPAAALLHLRADLGRDAQAGMLFLVHGDAATYHVGWSSEEGRRLGAHNLLLWHAIGALRERGLRRLDLGGVDTERGAGIARFKIGTGGAVVTLAGTYW
ncbi:MAG TPA: GNAT family N-acetyltransferase [Quisquiliibacterium sp.]|nr:GNAT family N-acetyltransferase [Quisquiliibacterium sp.]HPA90135.1 GNAT family N-acetyltransferase [Quisquiliibacterium sp.]HQD82996.1 GNAT family N-acetyltransferase [Quisquiliibacterium sp.]